MFDFLNFRFPAPQSNYSVSDNPYFESSSYNYSKTSQQVSIARSLSIYYTLAGVYSFSTFPSSIH